MQLIDTHCHIHSADYKLDCEEVYKRAIAGGVTKIICVGTDIKDSRLAIDFAKNHRGAFASIGVHPHEAKHGTGGLRELVGEEKIVAIGETGLDYFYSHSDKPSQTKALEVQLQLALDVDLPVIFHVREAFEDFWSVFNNFSKVRGVLHSFTDSQKNLEKALENNLYIGINGISTFTKDETQRDMFAQIPLESIVLETDAPYLTPKNRRGKVNEPLFVGDVAQHIATFHPATFKKIATQTTNNAANLFNIDLS